MKFAHTNLPIDTSLPKLVRDNIPAIIEQNEAKKANVRTAIDDKEFLTFLLKKIVEEATEVQQHTNKEELIKELADTKEVSLAIMQLLTITEEEIENVRKLKKAKNGGFEKRYILEKF